ncbi:MAG: GtrA family protein [Hydrogenophaga sp.]|nr:GtrA family protein [Hydrogenophaga sp.]
MALWRRVWVRLSASRFPRFACVGAVGFVVDAGILTTLMHVGWPPLSARLVSFPVAVATTWLLNKAWTFASDAPHPGGGVVRYSGIQIVGAMINLGLFTLLIAAFPASRAVPSLPLAAAALVALVFNYVASRHLVFKLHDT